MRDSGPFVVNVLKTCALKGLLLFLPLILFAWLTPEYAGFAADLLTTTEPDTRPPKIIGIDPPAGRVGDLTRVRVTFDEAVTGIDRLDLLLNDTSAIEVAGSGAEYTFRFEQPPAGYARLRWDANHGIADLARPANRFDETSTDAVIDYELVDLRPPSVSAVHPPGGITVRRLDQVEIRFDEPVQGIEAADLLVNGQAALRVSGLAAGPYLFEFASAAAGLVQMTWSGAHEISDIAESPNPFAANRWSYTVDPGVASGDLVINEIVAANESGLRDEEGDFEDWIEIYNRGGAPVDLSGWSLTDDSDKPGQWVFPSVTVPAHGYVVVFASGKDRRDPAGRLHTNFKLSAAGEYLGLHNAEARREIVSELRSYPVQRTDHSYGRTSADQWRYFPAPTPEAANGITLINGITDDVHFSVRRGLFNSAFRLTLSTRTPDAVIRYTTDGSEPTAVKGSEYTGPLLIGHTTLLRAVAFAPNKLPSRVETHTYLFNLPSSRRTLPVISIVTDTNHLFGRTGIMSTSPRNTTKRGIAWERPVSVEWIRPEDNGGFQIDAGLRIQGGNYVRERYDPRGSLPYSKYSFRLYFRGDYGQSKLRYPLFPGSSVDTFDHIVLRAGMNDHSNPFINDEMVRRHSAQTGQVSSHGALALLYLNGAYKGYYNPTERIDGEFLQSWHGGGEAWDVIAQFNEIREGTSAEWNAMRNFLNTRNLREPANYEEAGRRLDLVNFADYLLVNIYAATGDWPHNNWRAARERVPGSKFRFYVWDAEWSFGYRNPVTHNTISTELGSSTDIGNFYRRLRVSPEFKLLFADRAHKQLFNDGGLTDTNVLGPYLELRAEMKGVLPNMNTSFERTWVPRRREYILRHLTSAGLLASSNAPAFNQHGGRVPHGFYLTMSAQNGEIYYTTNGADPRVRFTSDVSKHAMPYDGPVTLDSSIRIMARTLSGTNWSALTEAEFAVAELVPPIRITELMYNPVGGDAYEFIELQNVGSTAVDLSFMSFTGVDFSFADRTELQPGAVLVIVSNADPGAFAARYPGVPIAGTFRGALSNGGETIALRGREGQRIVSVDYSDDAGWPAEADGLGHSLEIIDPRGDPDDPANWRSSSQPGGSPGRHESSAPASIVLNEIMAENVSAVPNGSAFPDWIELLNRGAGAVDIGGWSLTDDSNPRKFVFPAGTMLAPGSFLVIWCDDRSGAPGLHTGFGLSKGGETVVLYDADTNRVDAVRFAAQVADLSIGRIGSKWQPTAPTPQRANEAAELAPVAALKVNEWMANPLVGQSDWIELFNSHPSLPAALNGLYIGTSNSVFQISALGLIPPGGFLQLFADELPGVDHLDLKLSAAGDRIVLFDSAGNEVSRVVFGRQSEGISEGRMPDGSGQVVAFPGTASPGASNYLLPYSGPMFNELMAQNQGAVQDSAGRVADWIEIVNRSDAVADLSGMSISIGVAEPGQWRFPSGTSLGPNAFLVIWCDAGRAASTAQAANLNTGRNLPAESGSVLLFNNLGQVVDRIDYGFQVPDRSIGTVNTTWQLLSAPTPGQQNSNVASLGEPARVRFNEWMADPRAGSDWIELFNPDALPVQLSGLYLTDDPSIAGRTNYLVAPLSFIPANGWVRFEADGQPQIGGNHLNFSLDRLGETLRMYTQAGQMIDSVDFGPQEPDISAGRLPDGADVIRAFPGSPTPGAANFALLENLFVNEALTHTDPPLEDAIELFNTGRESIDISGWYLSDNPKELKKYKIPAGTVIPAKGFKVFYQYQFDDPPNAPTSFTLNSVRGEEVHLSAADAIGNLTGFRAVARFGPAANGVSFGRFETSYGAEFVAMSERTFGVDAPGSLQAFRTGTGAPNAYPRVGPVVMTEIMYHPVTISGLERTEDATQEFIELHNLSDVPVALFDPLHPANTWKIDGDVQFSIPQDVTLNPREFILIANFNPASDSTTAVSFREKYGLNNAVRIYGPYSGKLSNSGGVIRLLKPDPPQTSGPDLGLVPQVLVEEIRYDDETPWSADADGGGASLQRIAAAEFGNDPVNWFAAAPSAGKSNGPVPIRDADSDGMPDDWELANRLDPGSAHDAQLDSDGDGMTNLEEFAAGTFPRNALSALSLEASVSESGELLLSFVAASRKSYAVEASDDMRAAPWNIVLEVPASAGTRTIEFSPIAGVPTRAAQFYRIRVVQ